MTNLASLFKEITVFLRNLPIHEREAVAEELIRENGGFSRDKFRELNNYWVRLPSNKGDSPFIFKTPAHLTMNSRFFPFLPELLALRLNDALTNKFHPRPASYVLQIYNNDTITRYASIVDTMLVDVNYVTTNPALIREIFRDNRPQQNFLRENPVERTFHFGFTVLRYPYDESPISIITKDPRYEVDPDLDEYNQYQRGLAYEPPSDDEYSFDDESIDYINWA